MITHINNVAVNDAKPLFQLSKIGSFKYIGRNATVPCTKKKITLA